MSADNRVLRRKGRLARWLQHAAHLVRRWRLRAEAAQMVRDPYGEPPFPLSREQWEELCQHEAERQPGKIRGI